MLTNYLFVYYERRGITFVQVHRPEDFEGDVTLAASLGYFGYVSFDADIPIIVVSELEELEENDIATISVQVAHYLEIVVP